MVESDTVLRAAEYHNGVQPYFDGAAHRYESPASTRPWASLQHLIYGAAFE
jgi:hypothetical protein